MLAFFEYLGHPQTISHWELILSSCTWWRPCPLPAKRRDSAPTARCRARTLQSVMWMLIAEHFGHLNHDDDDCKEDDDYDGRDNLSRWHQTVAVPQLETNQWCLKMATMSKYTLWMRKILVMTTIMILLMVIVMMANVMLKLTTMPKYTPLMIGWLMIDDNCDDGDVVGGNRAWILPLLWKQLWDEIMQHHLHLNMPGWWW